MNTNKKRKMPKERKSKYFVNEENIEIKFRGDIWSIRQMSAGTKNSMMNECGKYNPVTDEYDLDLKKYKEIPMVKLITKAPDDFIWNGKQWDAMAPAERLDAIQNLNSKYFEGLSEAISEHLDLTGDEIKNSGMPSRRKGGIARRGQDGST